MRLSWLSRGIPLWIIDTDSSYDKRDDRDGDRRPVPGSQHSMEDTQPTPAAKKKLLKKSPKKSPKKSIEVPLEPAAETAETVLPDEQSAEAATTDVDQQDAHTQAKKKRADTQEAPQKK